MGSTQSHSIQTTNTSDNTHPLFTDGYYDHWHMFPNHK